MKNRGVVLASLGLSLALEACGGTASQSAAPLLSDPVAVVRQLADAVNRNDADAAVRLATDDVVLEFLPACPLGKCVGAEGLRTQIQRRKAGNYSFDIEALRQVGDVVMYRTIEHSDQARAAGVERFIFQLVVTLRNGRVAAVRGVPDLDDPQTLKLMQIAGGGLTRGGDAVSVLKVELQAISSGKPEAAISLLADTISVRQLPTFLGRPELWHGAAAGRAGVAGLASIGIQYQLGEPVQIGDTAIVTVSADCALFRQLGIAPVESILQMAVTDGQITAVTEIFRPDSAAKQVELTPDQYEQARAAVGLSRGSASAS